MSKRATMLGYGEKVFVMKKKDNVPGVGLYDLGRGIDPLKNRKRSISFGVSREVIVG
jgi:DNA-directed RNA polymerase subunit K/omega